jgi:hypothetical protein
MTSHHGAWQKVPQGEFLAKADAVHAQLIGRADDLAGCTGCSPEAAELAAITEVLEDYELKRWPVRPDYPASRVARGAVNRSLTQISRSRDTLPA